MIVVSVSVQNHFEEFMTDIHNLIFDLGNVLLHYRWKDLLRDLGAAEEDLDRIGKEMFEDPRMLWHEFDLGTYTTEELIAEFAEEFPQDAAIIADFIRHGEYMHVPRVQTWRLVHQLKAMGYRIYLLSNYPEELFRKHTEYADFMSDLDGMAVSYQMHESKPQPQIYHWLLEQYHLKASECIFFDDRDENILGAENCGIHGRLVTSQSSLESDLQRILSGDMSGVLAGCGTTAAESDVIFAGLAERS